VGDNFPHAFKEKLHACIPTSSLENFNPCNFSQGAEKEVFFQFFYAAKNLLIDFL
jgi:hypothetical protein